MTATLTAADMEAIAMPAEQCERFARAFPSGVTVTRKNAGAVANELLAAGIYVDLLARRVLSPKELADYRTATAPATAALRAAEDAACSAYNDVAAAASAAYRQAFDTAAAAYYASDSPDRNDVLNEALSAAAAVYCTADESNRKAYWAACSAADTVYYAAVAKVLCNILAAR